MKEDERIWAVKQLLFGYVKSPSLRHIPDPHSVTKLAQKIVKCIDRRGSIWRKWDGQRGLLLNSAVGCWIPIEDLRDSISDDEKGGAVLGKYQRRGDATKAIAEMAYRPEPKW